MDVGEVRASFYKKKKKKQKKKKNKKQKKKTKNKKKTKKPSYTLEEGSFIKKENKYSYTFPE